jgi:GTP-binding protein
VVVNKIDHPGARLTGWLIKHSFFKWLGASEEQLDFPVVCCSALAGFAANLAGIEAGKANMKPLFDAILRHVPARANDIDGPLQLQISALDYSSYVARLASEGFNAGIIRTGQLVHVLQGRDESNTSWFYVVFVQLRIAKITDQNRQESVASPTALPEGER